MKLIYTLIFMALLGLYSYGQTWIQKASLPNTTAGYWPVSFSIGGKLYVGGGYWNGTVLQTFFEYNPATNVWTQKGNMPKALYSAAHFVINDKGYVTCGGQQGGFSSNVYEYDPITDTWTTKSNFPGVAKI
jgi:N-acetylneuraminic acid mutarotase